MCIVCGIVCEVQYQIAQQLIATVGLIRATSPRLQLDEELLTAYLGEAAARQLLRHASGVRLLACRPASAAALAHARALAWQAVHPAPNMPGRLLALHAGALALLHEQLRLLPASGPTPLSAAPPAESPRLLRPQEAARMEQARRWLLAHAHESVSIRHLADELHMSESRLRRSFCTITDRAETSQKRCRNYRYWRGNCLG